MNHRTIKKEYCQSCGMPLRFDIEEYLGTKVNKSHSREYCYYCLKDGKYTVDISMKEMIDIWVKYTDKYNEYSKTNYSPSELRTILNKRLPTLKRWKQKVITHTVHHEAINKLKFYINTNLEKEININKLCHIANLSHFHLRRVFKNITGENIGIYIQRLRLEKIAHVLVSTNLSIDEILKQSSYQTKSSLAKAFRKHFGISMSACREQYISATPQNHTNEIITLFLHPEIKKIRAQKAICFPVEHMPYNKEKYTSVWEKLIHYRKKYVRREETKHFISISLDNPQITSPEQRRFYIGILTTGTHTPEGQFSIHEIPSGIYAIFRHKGNYALLPDLYQTISEKWLPQSGYVQENSMSFEIYLNSPNNTEIPDLVTEIYIPIKKTSNK